MISLPTERFLIEVPSDEAALAGLAETVERKLVAGRTGRGHMLYLAGCPHADSRADGTQREDQRGRRRKLSNALPWRLIPD